MKKKCFFILLICIMSINGFCQEANSEEALMSEIHKYEGYLEKNPDDCEVLLKLGICYHDISSDYGKKFGKEAVKYLKKAYELNPNVETRAWLGSAFTIIARDTDVIIEKISAVQEGIANIDGAIEDDPENLVARLVRIGNSINLPEDFQRLDKVDKDFNFLFKKIKNKPEAFNDVFDPGVIFLFKAQYLVAANKYSLAYQFAKKGLKVARDEETKNDLSKFIDDLE